LAVEVAVILQTQLRVQDVPVVLVAVAQEQAVARTVIKVAVY
jgi:hypothetical protein